MFKLLRKKAAPLVVFLYKLKKLAYLRSARAQDSSAHNYSTVTSIYQLDAAHKRKPQEMSSVHLLIILILFIILFLDYCGLPVRNQQIYNRSAQIYFAQNR